MEPKTIIDASTITSHNLVAKNIAPDALTRGSVVVRGEDNRVLLEIKPNGEVLGDVNDASEAGRIFARTLEQELGFRRVED